jgi:hypothetical protein
MLALMITSFIGEKMQRETHVRCAAHLDTRVGRKLLERWYGTFRSLLVYSDILQTLRKQLMHWHMERKKPKYDDDDDQEDMILRQPSDASQWKALDIECPEFGNDSRNVRLGVSTDGLNPFGSQSSTHST